MSDALEAARTAKERVAAALAGHPRVTGVGLARDDAGAPVVKVLLTAPADDLPTEQDGIPVVAGVVGRIERRRL